MVGKSTEQETFWQGEFGDEYITRNASNQLLAANTEFFCNVIKRVGGLTSALELGCNIGMNLRAIKQLQPESELVGVEINSKAVAILKEWGGSEVIEASILDVEIDRKFDLTFTKGVLIHINPMSLGQVYQRLYEYSQRYILVAEYYNPVPVEISYRGHAEKLFKRDFAGELMDRYSDLRLVDYGFMYHRDPVFPQDDISWFLLEKEVKDNKSVGA